MHVPLRILIAVIAFMSSVTAAAEDTTTTAASSGPPQPSQGAVWMTRKLQKFGIPNVASTAMDASCDGLADELRFLLLQLGARASDLRIDERGCRDDLKLVDATFSVVAPADKTAGNVAGTLTEARWQIVEFRTGKADRPASVRNRSHQTLYRNCTYLGYVTKVVLPLFFSRAVTVISPAVCDKTDVGLRAEILIPTQVSGASP